MTRKKVFISHSAHNEPAKSLLDSIAIELGKDFEVLGDKFLLQDDVGELWDNELDQWICECHAAVILFCADAIRSDWVQAETIKLCFRKRFEKDFLLIPVGVEIKPYDEKFPKLLKTTTDIVSREWWVEEEDLKSIPERIRQKIDTLNNYSTNDQDPILQAIVSVVELLASAQVDSLKRAGEAMGVDMSMWTPGNNRHRMLRARFADALFSCPSPIGMVDCIRNVKFLYDYDNKARKNLIEHILPYWIPFDDVKEIIPITIKTPGEKIFCLCSYEPGTPDFDDWQLSRCFPPDRRPILDRPFSNRPENNHDSELSMGNTEFKFTGMDLILSSYRKQLCIDPSYKNLLNKELIDAFNQYGSGECVYFMVFDKRDLDVTEARKIGEILPNMTLCSLNSDKQTKHGKLLGVQNKTILTNLYNAWMRACRIR